MDPNTFGLVVIGTAVVVAVLTLWARSRPRLRPFAWIGLVILLAMSAWAFWLVTGVFRASTFNAAS